MKRANDDKKSSTTVTFDVGGTPYRVSRTLLEAFQETMLFSISSELWNKGCTKDIFIDRNGERFQYILDYMRDNEVHLPCSVSKDALLNDFNFYGFKVDTNSIKITHFNITHIADEVQCWKKCRVDKLNELRTIRKSTALEEKYTKFCFMLSQHYISTREFQLKLKKYGDFKKYGSFYTHNEFCKFNESTHPQSKFLQDKMLQKCANLFQISHITAYYNKSPHEYHVKFGILKSAEENSLIAGEFSEESAKVESKNENDDSPSSEVSITAPAIKDDSSSSDYSTAFALAIKDDTSSSDDSDDLDSTDSDDS